MSNDNPQENPNIQDYHKALLSALKDINELTDSAESLWNRLRKLRATARSLCPHNNPVQEINCGITRQDCRYCPDCQGHDVGYGFR